MFILYLFTLAQLLLILKAFHLIILGIKSYYGQMTILSPSSFLRWSLFFSCSLLRSFSRADSFLSKPFVREDVEDSTEYLKNKTKKVTHLSFWDAANAVLRGDLLLPVLILGRGEKRNSKSS